MMNSILNPDNIISSDRGFCRWSGPGSVLFYSLVADSAAVAVREKSCASDARKFYPTHGGSDGGILFDYERRALGETGCGHDWDLLL